MPVSLHQYFFAHCEGSEWQQRHQTGDTFCTFLHMHKCKQNALLTRLVSFFRVCPFVHSHVRFLQPLNRSEPNLEAWLPITFRSGSLFRPKISPSRPFINTTGFIASDSRIRFLPWPPYFLFTKLMLVTENAVFYFQGSIIKKHRKVDLYKCFTSYRSANIFIVRFCLFT